jgi:hypothetical protein
MDGPAMRPTTPLAVENSVGKPAANAAPNVGMGKRAWCECKGVKNPNAKQT